MTGLARRTGWSVRLVRTGIELTVLAAGWALGGVVGVGTVLYALLIGPLVQFFLPRLTVALLMPDDAAMQDDAAVPDDAAMQDDAAMPDDAAMQDDAAAYPPATRPRERPGAPPRGGSATISAHAARS